MSDLTQTNKTWWFELHRNQPYHSSIDDVERYQSNSNASAIDIVVEKRPVGLKLVKARCDPISIFLCGPILCVIIVIVAILIICAVGYSILNGSIKF